jgi:hypothetical protein
VRTRFGIAVALAAAALLAAPASANAAALAAVPAKDCYRTGEKITLNGSGYTPNQTVTVTSDGKALGTDVPDAAGNFSGDLTVGVPRGEKVKTYTATDQSNPAITASLKLRVSALTVNLKPKSGPPGRRFRIGARGFTTGKRLYAHIVKGKFRRTVRVGRLTGPCHRITARKRLFPSTIGIGLYRVQFDTKRRYSRKTKVKIVRGFEVTRDL